VAATDRVVDGAGDFARRVLAIAGLAAMSLGLRFVYDGVAGTRRFDTWPDVLLYYVAPFGIGGLLLSSGRLNPLTRMRLLVCITSITVSCYAVEMFLSLVVGNDRRRPIMTVLRDSTHKKEDAAELTRKFGQAIDIRSPSEVLADLKAAGADVVPIVTPANDLFVTQQNGAIKSAISIDGREVIPLGGVSNKTTLLCNENGPWVWYRSDRHGFNNPDDVWGARPLDIAAVGDSFTHGYCVPPGTSFMDLIRQTDHATLNLGIAGNGPLLMFATLKEYLAPFEPKIVLWFYFEGNDLEDLRGELRSGLLRQYLTEGFEQHDLARQESVDAAISGELPHLAETERRRFDNRRRNAGRGQLVAFAKLSALRERLSPIGDTDPASVALEGDVETNMKVFQKILSLAKTRVSRWNGRLYFVYLPDWPRFANSRSVGVEKRDEVLRVVRELGLDLIDIVPSFAASTDPMSLFPFRGPGHYTERGHRLVAQEVLRGLEGAIGSDRHAPGD
jgi:hypothetical protein